MSEWKKVKIGDIFSIEKGSLQSSKCTPGEYDFITAATDWKTHNSFDHECEAIVYAVAASGSLGRAHYVNGKFIASDLCFILTEKNKKQYPINFLFYQIVFEMLRDEIVSKTKTGTSKESINRGNFSNYEIPYFPIEFQLANYQKFVNAKNTTKSLLEESEVQKNYIKQLRQNILQDAIEGKLTVDWRKQNPVQKGNPDYDAEALFKQIQKERSNEKKQKELTPITDEEKPFEIPESWKWVRLGEISLLITDGKHGDSVNQNNSGYFFLSAKDIQNGELIYTNARQITEKDFHETHRRTDLEPGDICIVNTGATVGKLAIAPDNPRTYMTTFQKSVAVVKLVKNLVSNIYVKFFLLFDVPKLMATSWGSAINNLLLSDMKNEPIPLPPLAEQKEIVKQVDKYLQTVSYLKNQIAEREQLTKQLLQSILKDAFD